MQPDRSADLARTTFQLLAIGALILSSFWILRPFLVASTWATTIAVATWPLLLHAEAWLGGRRSLAVAAMTIALLLILPFYFGVTTIVENAARMAVVGTTGESCQNARSRTLAPAPPAPRGADGCGRRPG
jgi:predicted PurR-regulated permease PerM